MHCAKQRFTKDCRARRLRHRGIGRTAAVTCVRCRNGPLCLVQPVLRRRETLLERFTYVEHAITVGTVDGRLATPVLP